MNRRRDGGVHEVMNRPDMYLKQIHGLQAWLHAHGDEEGAAQAGDLAEHLSRNHEAVDDQTTPTWAEGADDEVDVEPDIRCSPEPGCIFENHAGELILTVDMLDGGNVAVVHMGDVVRWVERRGAPDPEQARGLPETPAGAAERAASEDMVGEFEPGFDLDIELAAQADREAAAGEDDVP